MKEKKFNLAALLVFIPLVVMVGLDLQKWVEEYRRLKEQTKNNTPKKQPENPPLYAVPEQQ